MVVCVCMCVIHCGLQPADRAVFQSAFSVWVDYVVRGLRLTMLAEICCGKTPVCVDLQGMSLAAQEVT